MGVFAYRLPILFFTCHVYPPSAWPSNLSSWCGSTSGHCLVSSNCHSCCTEPPSSFSTSHKPSSDQKRHPLNQILPHPNQQELLLELMDSVDPHSAALLVIRRGHIDAALNTGMSNERFGRSFADIFLSRFCGTTDGHCLKANGCQNGCKDGNPTAPPTVTTSGEPVISIVKTSMAQGATATARVTTDGTCGGSNRDTVCGNWPNGNCCSMYGFW